MNNTNIIPFIKRKGDYSAGDFVAPLARFAKYPVHLDTLFKRIYALGAKYNLTLDRKVFRMNPNGIQRIKRAMKGKGGIYIWYSHITGYFYVGSAKVFFGKSGRLSTYLMPSRVNADQYLSKDLAKDLQKHGYESVSVIIVQQWDIGMNVSMLLAQEQLWMLLYPTYYRSLKVGSNEGQPMLESDRQALSTNVYLYEVENGTVVPGSEQVHHGKKELARTGFTSTDGGKHGISNFDLSPAIKTGSLYKGRFLLTTIRLEGDAISNWTAPMVKVGERVKGTDGRRGGVFVYKYVSPNHAYTEGDFIKFYESVTECRIAYGISKTQFQRVRRTGLESKNSLSSDCKLH